MEWNKILSKSGLASSALLCVTGGPTASAAIVLDPINSSGPSVTVSGNANTTESTMVELIVNDVSRGSIKASTIDGSFAFTTQSLTAGDKVQARASQVWNFNTDGDGEGWGSNDGSLQIVVAGGVLRATLSAEGGNRILLNLNNVGGSSNGSSSDGATTTHSRVLEFRMRNTTGKTNLTAFYNNLNPPSGSDVFTSIFPSEPDYVSYFLPLDSSSNLSTGYTTLPQVFWLGIRFLSRTFSPPTPAGDFLPGDFVDIDYIRLSEYVQWEFNNLGDKMGWVTGAGSASPSATSTVSNGLFTLTAGANGEPSPTMNFFTPVGQYDKTYFNNWTVNFKATTGTQNLLFFADGSGGPGSDGNLANKVYPGGAPLASFQELNTNLAGNPISGPTWYSDANRPLIGDMVFSFQPMEGGNNIPVNADVQIDYIRFGPSPATRLGPSNQVTVAGSSAVNEWSLY